MASAPFLLNVTGNPNTAAVTDINVRSGPGTNYDIPFKATVGTANLPIVDVQADAKGITLNNKIYQWLKVTFPNGQQGWVRDDLVSIVGDGSSFGYGVLSQPTNAFSLTRVISPIRQATTPAPSAPATTPTSDALDRVRKAAFNITSTFEGGGYSTYQNYDSGIISYGRFQFTLAAGALAKVVNLYLQRSHDASVGLLQPYAQRVTAKDATLRTDVALKAALIQAAVDTIMQDVQNEIAGTLYWQPVIDLSIKPRNIQSALGYALLFDMSIQHGLYNALVGKAETALNMPPKSMLGQNGISEHTFIAKLAEVRQQLLYALADKNNLPGLKVRGDFWVNLVNSGDWDLQGDADGNLNIKGHLRQVRNP